MKKTLKSIVGPFWSAAHTIPKVASEPSFYPERPRKCWLRRWADLLAIRFYSKSVDSFYNAYGLDIRGEGTGFNYVREAEFWTKIIAQNYPTKINHAVILRDKLLFFQVMSANGIPTPRIRAFSRGGRYYFEGREVDKNAFCSVFGQLKTPFFVKDASSYNGRGVWNFNNEGDGLRCDGKFFEEMDDWRGKLDGMNVIVQEAVVNHPDVAAIYPKSVNTARLITAWDDRRNEPVLFTQFFRCGANGNRIDNWAAGGLLAALSDDGRVGKIAFYKNRRFGGLKTSVHPETKIAFKDVRVPQYDKALELCLSAHRVLPCVKSIGWDVAFTPNGPSLIEGNDDWEIAPAQIVNGGLREKAKPIFGL